MQWSATKIIRGHCVEVTARCSDNTVYNNPYDLDTKGLKLRLGLELGLGLELWLGLGLT